MESHEDGGNESVKERRKSLRNHKTDVSNETAAIKNESVTEDRRKSLRTPRKPVAT